MFRFQDLQFQGDVEGALALLTDDVVVTGRGDCIAAPCVGKAAFRPELARSAAVHTRVTIVNLAVSPNAVVTRQAVQNDTIRAAGVERIINNVTFEFRDDKIAASRTVSDLSDPQTAEFFRRLAAAAAPAQPPAPAVRPPATGDGGLAADPSGSRERGLVSVIAIGAGFAGLAAVLAWRRLSLSEGSSAKRSGAS